VDDALDILEDVGFLMTGDQISPEVAHHYFFHWTRGYYNAAKEYLSAHEVRQPALWRHLAVSLDLTAEIEAEQYPGQRCDQLAALNDQEILDFLNEEVRRYAG
jgi:hypothetical protein